MQRLSLGLSLGLLFVSAGPLGAQQTPNPNAALPLPLVYETEAGKIVAADATGTFVFENFTEYVGSDFFTRNDMRCGARDVDSGQVFLGSDCSSGFTNPAAQYDPSVALYSVPVVVHVIQRTNGTGAISDALIHSQIDVLNEDFKALAGSLGAPGTDAQIEFFLATEDPNGNPTTGITRHNNNTWYNDSGAYYNSIGWDTTRYLNIYTNLAGGNLGYAYVPSGGGVVGQPWDGVRIYWPAFGRNSPYGPPYNLGRTTTHEVGHYLGLYHTFDGGCTSTSGCNSNGDLICDTNPESSPNFSPCTRSSCGSVDPTHNYMDYSDDDCMYEFTPEQSRRMRCTIENFRVDLVGTPPVGNPPGQNTSPSPSSGSSNVSVSASLSWSAGSGATTHDVYFGTDPTPDGGEFQGNQGGTSFDPGALANSTTYYWRVDSMNGDGTTTGAVWSFTTEAGGGTGNTLFADGFESGNFSAGGWTRQNNNARVAGGAAFTGSYGADLRQTTTLTSPVIDTSGHNTVDVDYMRRTSGYDSGEVLEVQYSIGGVWETIETTSATSWGAGGMTVAGNGTLRIRFVTNANRKNERSRIDDVVVSGN